MASITSEQELYHEYAVPHKEQPDFRVVGLQADAYGPRIHIERVADVPNEYASQYVPIAGSYSREENTWLIARSSWSLQHYLVHDPKGILVDLQKAYLAVFIDVTDLSAAGREPLCAVYKEPADIWNGLMVNKFERGDGEKSKEAVFASAGDLMKRLPEDDKVKFCEHLLGVKADAYKGCADSLQHPDPVIGDLAVNITTLAVQYGLAQIAGNELLRICKRRRIERFDFK